MVWVPGDAKLMVCARGAGATETVRVTGLAAIYVLFPSWLAVMRQSPSATKVKVLPTTVQTALLAELKVTDRCELAVALKVTVPVPNCRLRGPSNEIVCCV